jgi:hypothetical protein
MTTQRATGFADPLDAGCVRRRPLLECAAHFK